MKIKRVTAGDLLVALTKGMEYSTDTVESIGTVCGEDYVYVIHMRRQDRTGYDIEVYPTGEQTV